MFICNTSINKNKCSKHILENIILKYEAYFREKAAQILW